MSGTTILAAFARLLESLFLGRVHADRAVELSRLRRQGVHFRQYQAPSGVSATDQIQCASYCCLLSKGGPVSDLSSQCSSCWLCAARGFSLTCLEAKTTRAVRTGCKTFLVKGSNAGMVGPMNIGQYKTIVSDSPEKFDKEVNEHLANNFQLLGDAFALGNLLCQTMVKPKVSEIVPIRPQPPGKRKLNF